MFGVNCIIYIHFCLYPCLLLLSITLFVYHFILPCEVSKGIVYLYVCCGSFHHVSLNFLFWPFTFTQKFDCDNRCTSRINLVLSLTCIIAMLVKLLEMVWAYITRFLVSVSLCPCLYLWFFKIFHIIVILCHLRKVEAFLRMEMFWC